MAVIKYRDSSSKELKKLEIPISQINIFPEPSEQLKNKIFQYIGETTEDKSFVNGYFYKCQQIEDTEDYEWKKINVQNGGGGSSSLAGLSDVELDATPSANQVLTYDAENEKWINADAPEGGGAEVSYENGNLIINNSGFGKKYSTNEQIVGEWIDGKPIYERTLDKFKIDSETSIVIYNNIDTLIDSIILLISTGAYKNKIGRGQIIDGDANASTPYKNGTVYFERNGSGYWKDWDVQITIQYTKTTD